MKLQNLSIISKCYDILLKNGKRKTSIIETI